VVRAVVVVSTRDVEKAVLAARWAAAARRNGWVEEVAVFFFGPSEDLIASGDEAVLEALQALREAGVRVAACRRFAEGRGYASRLEELGVEVYYVGEEIARLIREGHTVLTF